MILPGEFYVGKDTVEIARALVGKVLVHESHAGKTSGRIVEVEAYCGNSGDPACHAARGKTKRNEAMFGPAGHAYIYFIFGMYHCFNVVVQKTGIADAVLIRAVQPLDGLELMQRRRGITDHRLLCRGPGRLCQAFDLTRAHNGMDVIRPPLYLWDDGYEPQQITASPRIGISQAREHEWRFYEQTSVFVCRV